MHMKQARVVNIKRAHRVSDKPALLGFASRDLLDDEQLSRKYNGVFSVLQEPRNAHLGAPASVLARIPAPGTEKNPIEVLPARLKLTRFRV